MRERQLGVRYAGTEDYQRTFDHSHLKRDQRRNDDIASVWIGMDEVQH